MTPRPVECGSVNTTSVQGASRCCAELANEPLGKLAANGQVAFALKLCDRPLGIWVNCSSWPDLAIAEFAQCALAKTCATDGVGGGGMAPCDALGPATASCGINVFPPDTVLKST